MRLSLLWLYAILLFKRVTGKQEARLMWINGKPVVLNHFPDRVSLGDDLVWRDDGIYKRSGGE